MGKASRSASREWERSGDHPTAGHGGGLFDSPSLGEREHAGSGSLNEAAKSVVLCVAWCRLLRRVC
jgi:hypothetical protein